MLAKVFSSRLLIETTFTQYCTCPRVFIFGNIIGYCAYIITKVSDLIIDVTLESKVKVKYTYSLSVLCMAHNTNSSFMF